MKRTLKRPTASDTSAFGVPIDHSQAEQQEWIQAMGHFLRSFEWTHIATLTFERPQHPDAALREFGAFQRDLERRSQSKVDWFVVVENTANSDAHIHALLNLRKPMPVDDIGAAWRGLERQRGRPMIPGWRLHNLGLPELPRRVRHWSRGRYEIEPYDAKLGWAYYILKNVQGRLVTWDPAGLPRLRVA